MFFPIFDFGFVHIPSGNDPCKTVTFQCKDYSEITPLICRPHCNIMAFSGLPVQWFICKYFFCFFRFYAVTQFEVHDIAVIPIKGLYPQCAPSISNTLYYYRT